MGDWTLVESGLVFILICGVPIIMAVSVGLWKCLKCLVWFIGKLVECVAWRYEQKHYDEIVRKRIIRARKRKSGRANRRFSDFF